MDELANPSGSRKDLVSTHCAEFMKLIKVLLPFFLDSCCCFLFLDWFKVFLNVIGFLGAQKLVLYR